MKHSLLLVCLLTSGILSAQYVSGVMQPVGQMAKYDSIRFTDTEASFGATVTRADLKNHLTIIASDKMEGRELGTKGNEMAGEYIASQFARMGLTKAAGLEDYYQPVQFDYTSWDDISLEINGVEYKHMKDFLSMPLENESRESYSTDEILFLGYGVSTDDYDDYRKNVEDKVILIYRGTPKDSEGNEYLSDASAWTIEKKLELAKKDGASAVLIIDDQLQQRVSDNRRALMRPQMTLGGSGAEEISTANAMYISTNILEDMLGKKYKKFIKARDKITAKGKPKSVKLPVDMTMTQSIDKSEVVGNNVIGLVEGSDPKLKEEVIIVSAHYDHIGRRGDDINNGADDNGSGTSTVLEIAEAFAQAARVGEGPRRTMIFMLVTGEEKGLLGSYYYSENPIYAVANTVANINIDMVGRVDSRYTENPHYVYVIGSDRLSTQLHTINEQKNAEYVNLTLDYKYNDEKDPNRFYFRSDHYNFARLAIPSIFFFNGTHPDYHRPSDTVEKINFEKMEAIGRHIFHLAWELSTRDARIVVDGKS